MVTRYRCTACGNLTRFDVVASRRTRAFHHYSVGGDLEVEDVEELEARVEAVTCRWCGATDPVVEPIETGAAGIAATGTAVRAASHVASSRGPDPGPFE